MVRSGTVGDEVEVPRGVCAGCGEAIVWSHGAWLVSVSGPRGAHYLNECSATAPNGHGGHVGHHRPTAAPAANTLLVQQWHDRSVNGAVAGSWKTISAEDHDGDGCPPAVFDVADVGPGVFRLQVTDPGGALLDTSEAVGVE